MAESNKSREERLAAALRANLRRRKAQSRADSGAEKNSAEADESPRNEQTDDE
jgi:hypothetical protein